MNPFITEKQQKVLQIIRDYYLENGYAPSLSELGQMLKISTKRGVVNHLIALEKKGFIIRTSEARGIQLVEEEEYEYLIGIPILGYANAGTPLAIAQEDRLGVLHVDKGLVKKNEEMFALIIKGDSMNQREIGGKKLNNGNYIIVSKTSDVRNGDVVVAILDNSATVKAIKFDNDMIVLYPQSDNPKHNPIYLDKYSNGLINGKVIMSLEKP